jgi:sporulation protein YabP
LAIYWPKIEAMKRGPQKIGDFLGREEKKRKAVGTMKSEEYRRMEAAPHNVILENRERLSVSGVSEVLSFDENQVALITSMGLLTIGGQQLHVEKLSLEMGEIAIAGQVEAVIYEDDQQRRRGFWSRLF